MNFNKYFKKCSILTPDIRKHQTSLESIQKEYKVQPFMATRGSYVHNYGKFFGGNLKMLILCNFLKILMVSDKIIHRALLVQLSKQNPLEKIFSFTIYQNYTLACITGLKIHCFQHKRISDKSLTFTSPPQT